MFKQHYIYQGKAISLNDWVTAHWRTYNSNKNKFKKIFTQLFNEKELSKIEKFKVDLYYNSRHDLDNTIALEKIFVDCFRRVFGLEDNKKIYKKLSISPCDNIPYNTFIFVIEQLPDDFGYYNIDLSELNLTDKEKELLNGNKKATKVRPNSKVDSRKTKR